MQAPSQAASERPGNETATSLSMPSLPPLGTSGSVAAANDSRVKLEMGPFPRQAPHTSGHRDRDRDTAAGVRSAARAPQSALSPQAASVCACHGAPGGGATRGHGASVWGAGATVTGPGRRAEVGRAANTGGSSQPRTVTRRPVPLRLSGSLSGRRASA